MKNCRKMAGTIVFAAVIGFSFIACNKAKDVLDGTKWKATYEYEDDNVSFEYLLTFSSPNLIMSMSVEEETEILMTGTYSIVDSTVIMNVTITMMGQTVTKTQTGTLSGKTLSFNDGSTFTKQ